MFRRTLLILAASLLLATAVACTSGDYDSGESPDVVLQVQTMTVPPITATLDAVTQTCTFEVTLSTASIENTPKTTGVSFSPANDVLITSLVITYQLDDGFNMAPYVTSPRVSIPAGSSGAVQFLAAPLAELLGTGRDGHSAEMTILFSGVTEANENVQTTGGAALVVNSCQ